MAVAGCVQVPVQSLTDYTNAFEEARTAGLLFLDEVAQSSSFLEKRRTGSAAPVSAPAPFPETFDPDAVVDASTDRVSPLFAARRAALDGVMEFNQVLIKLAEGRSLEEMRTDVAEIGRAVPLMVSLAQTAVPGAGIVLAALGPALREAELARSRIEFQRAVIAGEDDIHKIVTLLIKDTPSLYQIQKSRHKLERDGALLAAGQARRGMEAVASAYRAASGGEGAERERLALEAGSILSRLRGQPTAVRLPASASSAAPEYPADANRQLAVFVSQMRDSEAQVQAADQGMAAGYEAMRRYVLMLRKTQDSLRLLRQQVEAPTALTAGDLARVSVDVHDQAQRMKAALRQL